MTDPVLTYYNISPRVVAFSTTRYGGCSEGNYAQFNVNLYCGDNPSHIAANRSALCRLLQIDESRLVMPHQVHGTDIRLIDKSFPSLPEAEKAAILEGVDAVMTRESGICIGVSTADCIPILLYDDVHHAACAIHAGWRGTVARIAMKAVEAMRQAYGSQPAALKAVIGPGISLDSFEVGDEVYDQFAAAGFNMQQIARHYPAPTAPLHPSTSAPNHPSSPNTQHPSPNNLHPSPNTQHPSPKWHIDLWACNRGQLEAAGVGNGNIQVAGICTYQHCHEYFSARRLGINSGRILTAILLK